MPPRLTKVQEEEVDEEPSFCGKCNLKFKTWMTYHSHKIYHPNHRNLTCVICSMDFVSEMACKHHYNQSHAAKQNLPCPGCQQVFVRLGSLISHIETKACRSLAVPDFRERLQERKVFYDNHAEVRSQLTTSLTTGNLGQDTPMPIFSNQRYTTNVNSSNERSSHQLLSPRANVKAPPAPQASYDLLSLENSPGVDAPPLGADEDLISLDEPSRILNAPWGTSATITSPGIVTAKKTSAGTQEVKQATFEPGHEFPPLGGYKTLNATPSVPAKKLAGLSLGDNVWGVKKNSLPNAPQHAVPLTTYSKENTPWSVKGDISSPSLIATAPTIEPKTMTPDPDDDRTWSYNPSNPKFKAEAYWLSAIDKFKCPHKGCRKSFPKKGQFHSHVSTHAKPKESLQCRHCLRWFASATALTQHSESQALRCTIRERNDFNARVDEFTAGTATPAGRHADNTIRYAVNNLQPGESGVAKMIAAHNAAIQASEEDTAAYWDDKRPKW